MVAGCLSFTQLLSLLSSENKEKIRGRNLRVEMGLGDPSQVMGKKDSPWGKFIQFIANWHIFG